MDNKDDKKIIIKNKSLRNVVNQEKIKVNLMDKSNNQSKNKLKLKRVKIYKKNPLNRHNFPKKVKCIVKLLSDIEFPLSLKQSLGTPQTGTSIKRIESIFKLYEHVPQLKSCSTIKNPQFLDLLQFGLFHYKKAINKTKLNNLIKCSKEIIKMIEYRYKYITNHSLYDKKIIELKIKEVWLRNKTYDFVLDHWRNEYDVLKNFFEKPLDWIPVIGFIEKIFQRKIKLTSIGIFLSKPGNQGQDIHCDGGGVNTSEDNFNSIPTSFTVIVPLSKLENLTNSKIIKHNGCTEFYLGSHLVTSKGPFLKTVILAEVGDCIGWGYDLYHCGGPHFGDKNRLVAYFVLHMEGNEKSDYNLEAFKDIKHTRSLFAGTYKKKSKMRGMNKKEENIDEYVME